MEDKLRIEVNLFNDMMDELQELYRVTYNSDEKNGIVKARCVLYDYFRNKYNRGGANNEDK